MEFSKHNWATISETDDKTVNLLPINFETQISFRTVSPSEYKPLQK